MTAWQRAVELEQVAEAAGADPGPSARTSRRPASGSSRPASRRGASASCSTAQRRAMADAVEASPFDVDVPPGGDDARPEAARREALALAGLATEAARDIAEAGSAAAGRAVAEARAELERLGDPADAPPRSSTAARARAARRGRRSMRPAPASAAMRLRTRRRAGALTAPHAGRRGRALRAGRGARARRGGRPRRAADPGADPLAHAPGRRDRPLPARRLGGRRRRRAPARGVRVWRRFTGGGAVYLDPGTLCVGTRRPGGPSRTPRSASPTCTRRSSTGSPPPAVRSASTRPVDERTVRVGGRKVTGVAAHRGRRGDARARHAARRRRPRRVCVACLAGPRGGGLDGRPRPAHSRPDHVAQRRRGYGRRRRRPSSRRSRAEGAAERAAVAADELELAAEPAARALRRPRVACRTVARRHPERGERPCWEKKRRPR